MLAQQLTWLLLKRTYLVSKYYIKHVKPEIKKKITLWQQKRKETTSGSVDVIESLI